MTCRRVLLILLLFLATTACHPKPDYSVVYWGQADPAATASTHVKERDGLKAYLVLPTGSMEPMITGGDYVVIDTKFPFADIKAGYLLTYSPIWQKKNKPPVTHMAAKKYPDGSWIMSGINNANYENGKWAITEKEYIGRVVAVYTKRPKP